MPTPSFTDDTVPDSHSPLAQLSQLELPGEHLLNELLLLLEEQIPHDACLYLGLNARGAIHDIRVRGRLSRPLVDELLGHWPRLRKWLFEPTDAQQALPAPLEALLSDNDFHHLLPQPLHDGEQALGAMLLLRQAGSPAFTSRERQRLEINQRHFCRALSRRAPAAQRLHAEGGRLSSAEWAHHGGEATMLVSSRDGQIRHADPLAWTLLQRALGQQFGRSILQDELHAWAQPSLSRLLAQLPDQDRLLHTGQISLHAENRYGRFRFHVHALQGGIQPLLGLRIERRVPLKQRLFALPRFRNLTPRERDVCMLLAHNHTHVELAEALGIKPSTAIYHIRNVYQRLGINQRAELLPALMDGAD